MSFNSLLINTCTIQQYTEGAIDEYGNPAKDWDDTVVNCRWSTPSNREVKIGAEVVIADLQLFLTDEVVVTEQDRVVIEGKTYEVLSSSKRQDGFGSHHRELLLRTVR